MTVTSEQSVEQAEEIPSQRVFRVEVMRAVRLSTSFIRVTFTGDDLRYFADNGYDQRIKVVLPHAEGGFHHFPENGRDWYQRWRALPSERKNQFRTYTVRAVRQDQAQVDVDFVLHGDSGPASRWVARAQPGAPAILVGPNAAYGAVHGGLEWRPPAEATSVLLAGDETTVPAITNIIETLPAGVRARVLLEVPAADDALPIAAGPDVEISWLARGTAAHGELLVPAVRQAALSVAVAGSGADKTLNDVDVDTDILWEVPDPQNGTFYAWLAGEAGVVKTLRRYLVQELGVDRRAVAFMGYWRTGRSEPN
ncbi:NADPH-dependent ferric siderophore reductase, contains FAD-binding and SIP domains [Sinosporangium album]|uniref:NADPH-dependent ferric siderophore reductase, contains FAD-binding and SIP domains n=1 Tax=Sinosporangium album TaxID=504805 RepID=A0A1G7UYH0_9ACTN|nr:siderophore-interacting protein [Sinosporangium album]SDG52338.1 NADPH-dependent ferric siderophore reductase, contains FAD-binding and SIP domains [Sinosporangium album]